MPDMARVRVSVVYAEPERAFSAELDLPAEATVGDALAESGIRTARPDIEVRPDWVGVFAHKVGFDTPLHDGDRVEIYRPLRCDPKEARRNRARRA